MSHHSDFTDDSFLEAFANCSFPRKTFTHEAHLRLALLYIKEYGEEYACEKLADDLKKYSFTVSDGSRFHYTITCLSVRIVALCWNNMKERDFDSLITHYPLLTKDFKKLVSEFYSIDIFNDSKAKAQYIKPDKSLNKTLLY